MGLRWSLIMYLLLYNGGKCSIPVHTRVDPEMLRGLAKCVFQISETKALLRYY